MSDLIAACRLQLGPQFGFEDALEIVPYLQDLGVSHLYLSPIWQARAGSTHGYDVIDPTWISADLGGEEAFIALAHSPLGIIVDVVPNHMAADDTNPYWRDQRLRQQFFDIDAVSGFRRRFFDINDLVGVRVEDPYVFDVTHGKLRELVEQGLVDGVRIDHIDGLADPATYLNRLAQFNVKYVWVEKILETGEQLRSWPVEGTTGYDFMNEVTAVFVDEGSEAVLTALTGEHRSFAEIAHEAKLEQAVSTFVPELERLRSLIDVPDIARALAALPIYRTYVEPRTRLCTTEDRLAIADLPEPIRSVIGLDTPAPDEFVVRFQQTSGAVMAKGVEDTALYRYVRLLALNEVGGDPQRFGISVDAFHHANQQRATQLPLTLVASQTHDTKRSGDVRARLLALTYCADEWAAAVRQWHNATQSLRASNAAEAPDWTEELFIYQTLIGGWPIGMDRLGPYIRKSLREAKRNTNWIHPDEDWEDNVIAFCERLCADHSFLKMFMPLADRIALLAEQIALAQVTLRFSAPGVPDLYQGDELWNFSFVDPNNRRPVDWLLARTRLADLRHGEKLDRENAKLFVTATMLDLRSRQVESFRGAYVPIPSSPTTCAYRRGENVVVAVAVREEPIEPELPHGRWTNMLQPLEDLYSIAKLAVFERG